MHRTWMAGGVFALAALGSTGCGGTKVTGDSTAKSAKQFLEQTSGGKIDKVSCPDTDYKKGNNITCDVTAGAKKGKIIIQMGAKSGKKVDLKPVKVTGF